MPFYERLRPNADRLAQLLGDERGRELLAELQKLRRSSGHAGTGPQWAGSGWASSARPGEQDEAGPVGAWLAEPGEGGVALRPRDDIPAPQRADWAQDGYVPPPGTARRVVLIGESAARGWPLDPVFNPAAALRRRLAAAAPGRFQVVDLAKTGAGAADLITVLRQLPVARPDIVIAFAGNNWSLPPEDTSREPCLPAVTEIRDLLAQALRCGGYGAMRRAFIDAVVLPRARQFCAELAELHRGYGAEIIVVIPEFNLRGWRPPGDVEVPVLPAGRLARWYELYERAVQACAGNQWREAQSLVASLRELDGGTSPVPGQLLGRLAESSGKGAVARAELEDSRDAVCGLFIRYPPRAVREVQQLLATFAAENGFSCVDLRRELASADLPELPDERFFHDYCHLTDLGMERAMAPVAAALLGSGSGLPQTESGVGRAARAFAHAHAAVHLAYQAQPASVVRPRLRAALAADPGLAPLMSAVLDLLSCSRPAWIHPVAGELIARPEVADFAVPLAVSRGLSVELWVLRECLAQEVGDVAGDGAATIDLLELPDSRGHLPPNCTAGSFYHRASARRSLLAFAASGPCRGVLDVTYRMPTPVSGAVSVSCNDTGIGELQAQRRWSSESVGVPAGAVRPGVNWISFDWPVAQPDADACYAADATALACGEFPTVLPVFGEIFHAVLRMEHEPG
ncbi:MAG TPA: hypothetical protein VKS82_07070 [Streptosporangiaceae bacterium]|nr:hypothetical protein [Streptosporangiaceae bacterium]